MVTAPHRTAPHRTHRMHMLRDMIHRPNAARRRFLALRGEFG
jgi:hypothetical protein